MTSTPVLSGVASALYHGGALADRAAPFAYGAAVRNALNSAPNGNNNETGNVIQDRNQHRVNPYLLQTLAQQPTQR